MPRVIEEVLADANPSETRLSMFQRLAKLQLNRVQSFNKWADVRQLTGSERETAEQAWSAAWESTQTTDLWDVVRTLAIFDESFRLPQLNAGEESFRANVEEKFSKLMQRVSILALTIQRKQEAGEPTDDASSNSERNLL